MNERRSTREVRVGNAVIGGEHPIVIQSMTATKTQDIEGTVRLVNDLEKAGAGVVRIAVDSKKDAEALSVIRAQTTANLSVDLQENYRLAAVVAPFVDKIRYNPGHLHHHEQNKSAQDKVAFFAEIADKNDCAIRIGVNCGSVDPELGEKYGTDSVEAIFRSAIMHSDYLEGMGFTRYMVSLKDSDPLKVIEANERFAKERPNVPLHLGVTEAGLPPEGIIKTRVALEHLLGRGIGETLRVSLTVPNERKDMEIEAGRRLLENVMLGKLPPTLDQTKGLNIISCPSCSRVENAKFVDLAQSAKALLEYAISEQIIVAIMGCRVNGPGESVEADIGMWCGPNFVNMRRKELLLGAYPYDKVLQRLKEEVDLIISKRA